MSVLTLPVWYDVDDAPSLARLRESALAAPADLPRLYQWFHSDEG
jgi:hypothetical protein